MDPSKVVDTLFFEDTYMDFPLQVTWYREGPDDKDILRIHGTSLELSGEEMDALARWWLDLEVEE